MRPLRKWLTGGITNIYLRLLRNRNKSPRVTVDTSPYHYRHQRELRFYPSRTTRPAHARKRCGRWRGARRRCRPSDAHDARRHRDRRRHGRGRMRARYEAPRVPARGHRRVHCDVQPRVRPRDARQRYHCRADEGGRPLCSRGDAREGLCHRRRAIGPHDPS